MDRLIAVGFIERVAIVALVILLGLALAVGVAGATGDHGSNAPFSTDASTDSVLDDGHPDGDHIAHNPSPSVVTDTTGLLTAAGGNATLAASSEESPEPDPEQSEAASPGEVTPDPIEVEYEFDFAEGEPLNVGITISFPEEYRDRDGEFTLDTSPSRFTCDREDGFFRSRWDGERSTATATCEIDLPVENTQFGGYDFYATDEWAFARLGVDPQYTEDGVEMDHLVEESMTPDAAVGDGYTFVGPHETHTVEVAGQEIRLIVPDAAELSEDEEEVLDSLAFEARNVRVDTRTDEVDVFVTTDPIRGGGQAHFAGGSVWVSDGSSLAWNTWGHEYVHTRQTHRSGSETEWLIEGEARYFQYLLSYKQGHIDDAVWRESGFDAFQHRVAIDETEHADVTLSDQDTWASRSNYEKGALVLAALDAEIRDHTDGERTYQDVLRNLNQDGNPSHDDFVSIVEDVAGEPMDDFMDRYVTGSDIPSVPDDESLYRQGDLDWDVAYELDLGPANETAILDDERIEVPVSVENVGSDPAVGVELTFEGDGFDVVAAHGALVDGDTLTWSETELAPDDSIEDALVLEPREEAIGEQTDLQLTVADDDGIVDETATEIAVVDPPSLSVAEPEYIAIDDDVVTLAVDVEPGSEPIEAYEWEGSVDETTDEPALEWQPDEPGEYATRVTAVDEKGYTDSVFVNVIVTDTPVIEPKLPETTPIAAEPVDLGVAVENEVGEYSVTWELPDEATETGEKISADLPPGEHELTVTVEDEYGATTSETVELLVTDRPTLDVVAPEDALIDGDPVELAALVDNEIGEYSVTWGLPDDVTETGEELSADILPGEHEIGVTVEDEYGAKTAETVALVVTDEPAVEIETPSDAVGDEPAELAVEVENDVGDVDIAWELPDGTTAHGLTVEHVFDAGTHEIQVTVEDEYGAETTETTDLQVKEPSLVDQAADETPGFTAPITFLTLLTVFVGLRRFHRR